MKQFFNIIIIFTTTFFCFSCSNKQKKIREQVNKISKSDLEIIFEYDLEAYSINDYLIPVTEIKSSYSEFSVSTYDEDNNLSGSANYLEMLKKNRTMKNEKLIDYTKDEYGRFTFFHYDNKNKLIKKSFKDQSNKGQGYVEFIYNSDYSKMEKIVYSEYDPITPQNKVTLNSYLFDINGRLVEIEHKGNNYVTYRYLKYYDNGLIKNIINMQNVISNAKKFNWDQMPPFYDIYGLSKQRDKKTIETFLDFYCHQNLIGSYVGQGVEIAIYKNDKYKIEEHYIPVDNLSEVIDYGLNHPNIGFAFYIGEKANYKRDIDSIILKFTFDGKIIFGISVEENRITDNGMLIDNYERALEIEKSIAELTNSTKTSIQFEYAPSDDEEDFDSDIEVWRNMNEEKQNK